MTALREPKLPPDSSLFTLPCRLCDLNALGRTLTVELFLLLVPGVRIPVFIGSAISLVLAPPVKPNPDLVEVVGAEVKPGGKDVTPARGLSFPLAATTRGRVSG